MKKDELDLKDFILDIPDHPKPGIIFRDLTPLMKDPKALDFTLSKLYQKYKNERIGLVASIESRGFIFGAALAWKLGAGFVPIRKPGKLPRETECAEYGLEYGKDSIEIHKDAVKSGDKVLLVDDLLATGGTAAAAVGLIRKLGGEVAGLAAVVELDYCEGREKLPGINIYSLVHYE